MQRWLSPVLGVLALALVGLVVYRSTGSHPAEPTTVKAADAAHDAGVKDSGPAKDAGSLSSALDDLALLDHAMDNSGGASLGRFPDGRLVPPLPPGAPKRVRLGIVLIAFAGAEGAPPGAHAKKDALEVATKLASDAKTDFHGAVMRGDIGSGEDIGHIPRGILEPSVEYMVFTLPVGSVSDPIETPKGYWVAKRLE
jgi:PPIC-type PPIASE domain